MSDENDRVEFDEEEDEATNSSSRLRRNNDDHLDDDDDENDSENESTTKQQQRTSKSIKYSSDEEQGNTTPPVANNTRSDTVSLADIFGSDDEDEESDDRQSSRGGASMMDASSVSGDMMMMVGDYGRRGISQVTTQEIPPVQDIPSKGLLLFKLPGALKFEPRIYSREQIIMSAAESQDSSTNFRNTSTVRWRKDPETNEKQSNTRIVKWSDGSFTLHVGDEVFDMNARETRNDHAHLYNRLTNNVIYGQGKFTKRLTFQPSTSRMIAIQASNKRKAQQVLENKRSAKLTFFAVNPDHEEVVASSASKKQGGRGVGRQRSDRETKSKRNINNARLSNKLLEEGFESDEDDEAGEGNIGAMKKKYKKQAKKRYSDDEEEDDDDEKEGLYDEEEEDEEEEEEANYSESEEEDDSYRRSKKKPRR